MNLETHEDEEDKDKFMCLIEFKNIPQKYFLCLEPMTKEELNKKLYEFLENNNEIINMEEKKEKDGNFTIITINYKFILNINYTK